MYKVTINHVYTHTDMRRCRYSRLSMAFSIGYRIPNSHAMLKFLSLSPSNACWIFKLSTAIVPVVGQSAGIQSDGLRRALPHSCCQWQWHWGSRNAEIKASLLIPVYATCTCPLLVNIRSSSSHNTTYSAKNCWNKHKHMILIGSSFMIINCTVVNNLNITKQNNTTLAFNW